MGKSLAEVAFDKGYLDVYELLEPTMVCVRSYFRDMQVGIEKNNICRIAVRLTETERITIFSYRNTNNRILRISVIRILAFEA